MLNVIQQIIKLSADAPKGWKEILGSDVKLLVVNRTLNAHWIKRAQIVAVSIHAFIKILVHQMHTASYSTIKHNVDVHKVLTVIHENIVDSRNLNVNQNAEPIQIVQRD
jgi:hypothetical protein